MKKVALKASLIRGFLILLPTAISAYILILILGIADNLGKDFLKMVLILNPDLQKFIYPGAGLILILILCYLIGRLSLKEGNFFNRILRKIPILSLFVGKDGRKITLGEMTNWIPCLFWKTATVQSFGFIVGFQKTRDKAEEDVIVYFANPPLLITGEICIVPKALVIKLANPSREILNMLLLFGKVKPEELIPLPWDDETTEEFQKRINSFGGRY